MKIYLAARYARHVELQSYAKDLERRGHHITSRWIRGDHELRADGEAETERWAPVWAQEDWEDLCAATCCISFTEAPGETPGRARGGRHVEFGVAVALDKRCMVVGHREHVFHWLPNIECYATWDEALDNL